MNLDLAKTIAATVGFSLFNPLIQNSKWALCHLQRHNAAIPRGSSINILA
jgi:hypothetical protein